LRIGRLDYVNRLPGGLLHLHLHLLVGAQCARGIRLCAQSLNRIGHRRLVRRKCDADSGVIVDVLRHHRDHLRKIHQRDERRIEPRRLRRIGERSAGEIGILYQPIINVENFLRVRARGRDLRQQRIRIERHRRQQLIQLVSSGRSSVVLRADQRHKVLRKYQRDE
jgi:hypothetical protein